MESIFVFSLNAEPMNHFQGPGERARGRARARARASARWESWGGNGLRERKERT